jgi:hypothetical protein
MHDRLGARGFKQVVGIERWWPCIVSRGCIIRWIISPPFYAPSLDSFLHLLGRCCGVLELRMSGSVLTIIGWGIGRVLTLENGKPRSDNLNRRTEMRLEEVDEYGMMLMSVGR